MSYLYETTDFRKVMARALSERGIKHRDFARALSRSDAWLSLVLAGRRRFDPELTETVAQQLGLDPDASAYFAALVDLDNPSARARSAAWATVHATQRQRSAATFSEDVAALFSRWYVAAIEELARCAEFRAEPRWIAGVLVPAISVEQAEEALTLLVRLGRLRPDERGSLSPNDQHTWSPSDLPQGPISDAVILFHRDALRLADAAIAGARFNERHLSGMVFALSETHQQKIIAMLRDLERQIALAALEGQQAGASRVYLLGVQLFPVSLYTDSESLPSSTSAGEP